MTLFVLALGDTAAEELTMAESDDYKKLKNKLNKKHPVFAKYKDETNNRELCPHVLGYKKESDSEQEANEAVLCYQIVGPAPNPGWRCFHLSKLKVDDSSTPDPGDWVTPSNYSKWQNAVQKVKHKV